MIKGQKTDQEAQIQPDDFAGEAGAHVFDRIYLHHLINRFGAIESAA